MAVKKCLRCGMCCSGMFAIVPRYESSNLSPQFLETLGDEALSQYIDDNGEPMGKPCKWLARDAHTTEATCRVHSCKSSHCLDHPEHIVGNEWCPIGRLYWKVRLEKGLPIPESVKQVLETLGR